MYKDIQEMYIEEEVAIDSPTYTDVIVGQLTYRVNHTTLQGIDTYANNDPDAELEGYYTYDCEISSVYLLDEHCVVLTDVTEHVPAWVLTRLAITIEEHAESVPCRVLS